MKAAEFRTGLFVLCTVLCSTDAAVQEQGEHSYREAQRNAALHGHVEEHADYSRSKEYVTTLQVRLHGIGVFLQPKRRHRERVRESHVRLLA